jgi:putative membrane protein
MTLPNMHARRSLILAIASIVTVALLLLSGAQPFDRTTWVLEVFPVVIVLPLLWGNLWPLPADQFALYLHLPACHCADDRRRI